ncbi:hypothetical protein [Haloarcula salina]|uniref:Uncharacterized protein n=1 Tax=Haloarcula salina TaxID=1429914 RepID=A0AA41FZG5_9EURY|nr:hypothetical protein [Haloarcula salina]MBV0901425.1 hypothetical protein [Haloarcula salina]
MNAERWWPRFVDVAAVVWTGLFVTDMGAAYGHVTLSPAVSAGVRWGLQTLLLVFLLDVVVLYRWSEQRPLAFVRSNWFWILTVVPWFRPLRALRIGRGLRALRALAGVRKVGSLLNKARRTGTRLLRRLRE